jgi:hypothetical protein
LTTTIFITSVANAGHPWLSARTTGSETLPMSVYIKDGEQHVDIQEPFMLLATSQPSQREIDIVISIHNSPQGDDNGNYQPPDEANYSEQDKIEQIIKYFADAVYECTEGMNILRSVRIFRNGVNANACDIKWVERINPYCAKSIGNPNGRIYFADEWKSGYLFWITDDANREKGGYALGHEWGRYYYGLYHYCPVVFHPIAKTGL